MIGIDLVRIDRIGDMQKRFGDRALLKFLHVEELELSKHKTETVAGFWASKEAVAKALGVGIGSTCSFADIKIHKSDKNAPYFTLSKSIVDRFKIVDTALSITHDDGYAIAVARIETSKKQTKNLYH